MNEEEEEEEDRAANGMPMSDAESRGGSAGSGDDSGSDGSGLRAAGSDDDRDRAPDHSNTRDAQGPAKRRKLGASSGVSASSSTNTAQNLAAQEQAALRLLGGV